MRRAADNKPHVIHAKLGRCTHIFHLKHGLHVTDLLLLTRRPPGGFAHVQLLPGRPLQAALPGLAARLLEQLLREPPYELGWLGGLSSHDKVGQAGSGSVMLAWHAFRYSRA
jgi:hypothetical protein